MNGDDSLRRGRCAIGRGLEMRARWVLLVKAAISLVIAFFLLFFPLSVLNSLLKWPLAPVAQWEYPSAWVVIKLGYGCFAGTLIGTAIICYAASQATAATWRKPVILGLAVADVVALAVTLIPMLGGWFGYEGYVLILLWLAMAVMLLYLYVAERRP